MRAGTFSRPRSQVLIVLLLALFCSAGCDVFVFSDEGMVKSQIKKYAKAIDEEKWRQAAQFHHAKSYWESGGKKLQGQAAVKGFLNSVKDVQGRDGFYVEVGKLKKLSDTRVVAQVEFRIHIVESAMALRFSKRSWRANMLWVKQDKKTWKIANLKETSARVKPLSPSGTS